MPIRPSERARYPKDWKAISLAIRKRADYRCECRGECGIPHHLEVGARTKRCLEVHLAPARNFNGKVVLTTAHLDHTPENCDPMNLRAYCQSCHLRYDHAHHMANARRTREAKRGPTLPGFDATTPRGPAPARVL